jgi:hypothetical protein
LSPSSDPVIRAAVVDGVTLGHPCCLVLNCAEPLPNNRARYCKLHEDEASLCAIIDCSSTVVPGRRTCSLPEHQGLEDDRNRQAKAFFQLRKKIDRNHASYAPTSSSRSALAARQTATDDADLSGDEDTDDEEAIVDDQGGDSRHNAQSDTDVREDVDTQMDCDVEKSAEGNSSSQSHASTKPKVRARFGRRRTHNEELCVACCGVILGRQTMFGSESLPQVVVSQSF